MRKIHNKGGRPRLSAIQKKKYKVNVKMVTADYYFLKGKAEKANCTKSEFIRQCIRKGYINERISKEQMAIMRDLSGMANNLNQIARKANSVGYRETHKECRDLIEKIVKCIKLIKA